MKSHSKLPFALVGTLLTSLVLVAAEPPITALTFPPKGKQIVAASQSGIHVLS